jgi:hypothetical protein
MKKCVFGILFFVLSSSMGFSEESKPPVYALISFNINLPQGTHGNLHVDAIKRHLLLMEKYGIPADYYFTWPALKQLLAKDPQFVQRIREAGMDVHHHGANRPPRPPLIERIDGENWEQDVQRVREYETHDIDLRTGKILDASGGLYRMRDWLDSAFFSTGRFFQASILYVCKGFGAKMAVGLKDNTGGSREDAWFMGVLIRPSNTGIAYRAILDGKMEFIATQARQSMEGRSSSRPFVFAIPIHDFDFFQEERQVLSREAQEEKWSHYEKFLAWLAQESGIQVLSMRELYAKVVDDRQRTMTSAQLLEVARILSESGSELPEYIDLGKDYFSLTDAFQALTYALRNKRLSEPASSFDILGPTEEFVGIAQPIQLSGGDILKAAQEVDIHAKIPSKISVGSYELNPAEFLVAMAQEFIAVIEKKEVEKISLHSVELLPLSVRSNTQADKLTRLQFWTFKPIRWKA